MSPQAIVLGAGRPHRGSVPSALRTDRAGTPVLDWLLDAIAVPLEDVIFVGGFGVEAVRARFPDLRVVVPRDWRSTGSAASLLAAELDPSREAIVAYSDILVRPELVEGVSGTGARIGVAWDSQWRSRFAGRRVSSLAGLEKVVVQRGRSVARLGDDVPTARASGEFVGLVHLTTDAIAVLHDLGSDLLHGLPARAHLSRLVDALRAHGLDVEGRDALGDWAEIDEPEDIARFVLGTKADTLARLGRLVTRSRVADQVTLQVRDWERDPEGSVRVVRDRFSDRRLIVRSSTTHEDAFSSSNAGGFASVLGVTALDGLLDAVGHVVRAYRQAGIDADVQQVLVQPLVPDVTLSGVALTRTLQGAPWRIIEFSRGSDTSVVTSGAGGDLVTLFALRRDLGVDRGTVGEPASGTLALLRPALEAIDEVERLLGHDALDLEFALDGSGTVHLLQTRPAVTATLARTQDDRFAAALRSAHRTWEDLAPTPVHLPGAAPPVYGIMPDWNPAEIIGTSPGRLALDLYRRLVTDEVWARQRAEAGYRDVRPLPLLVDFAGHPYVDVRASFASFIPGDLDDDLAGRLLESSLERLIADPRQHDKVEFAIVPTCVDPDWERWRRTLLESGVTEARIGVFRDALSGIGSRMLDRVEGDLSTVRRLSERAVHDLRGVTDPLRRATILLDLTVTFGTLPFAHLARAAFVAVSQLRGGQTAGLLSEAGADGFHDGIRTVSGDLMMDATAVRAGELEWEDFVGRWGHLRPGTYDIRSPRYDADPDRFLRPLVESATDGDVGSRRAAAADAWSEERSGFLSGLSTGGFPSDADELETRLRRAIEGREWAKLAFTRSLSDALELIASGWERLGISREQVADVPLEMLLPDSDGAVPDAGLVSDVAAAGRARREVAEATPMAQLLTAEGDLQVFVQTADTPNFVGTRSIVAPVVELDEGTVGVDGLLDGRIAMIERADPGYDWIFGHRIAGLVTLFGGVNSHMAIRAAEHGLPAAIGVGEQRFRALRGALEVELDPRSRTLRRVG